MISQKHGKQVKKQSRKTKGSGPPDQLAIGKIASQDANSARVDTDRYNTSGNAEQPPKTPEKTTKDPVRKQD